MIEKAKWYVLHTYSGYENIVKANLEKLIEKNNLEDRIFEITVPVEDVVEEKNGKRKVVQRRLFPCYVLIKMDYENNMWHTITGVKGVTGFVGPLGRPMPLTDDEIRRMRLEKPTVVVNFAVGDKVKVISGPLESFVGEIETIDSSNAKCKVMVEMFGRQTPVELETIQIEKI